MICKIYTTTNGIWGSSVSLRGCWGYPMGLHVLACWKCRHHYSHQAPTPWDPGHHGISFLPQNSAWTPSPGLQVLPTDGWAEEVPPSSVRPWESCGTSLGLTPIWTQGGIPELPKDRTTLSSLPGACSTKHWSCLAHWFPGEDKGSWSFQILLARPFRWVQLDLSRTYNVHTCKNSHRAAIRTNSTSLAGSGLQKVKRTPWIH